MKIIFYFILIMSLKFNKSESSYIKQLRREHQSPELLFGIVFL